MQEYNKQERAIMIAYLERRISLLEEISTQESIILKGQLERAGATPWDIEEAIYNKERQDEEEICRLLGVVCYLDDYKHLRATLSKDIIAREDKQADKVYQALKRLNRI